MASKFYNNHLESAMNAMYAGGSVPSGTVKAALMTTSYTFDETDAFFSDLTGEASGTGYTSGGQAIDGLTVTQNDAADGADLDFTDEVFSNITVTNVNAYVLYYDTGTPSTSELIAYVEFTGDPQSITSGDFTIQPPAAGALRYASA